MSSDTTPQSGPDAGSEPAVGPVVEETPPPPPVPPQSPAQDPSDPWQAPWQDPSQQPGAPAGPSRAERRRRWQVGGALLLAVVTGAAAAVLVTLPERTDVPGLATPNDGRYAFPELTLPPLPVGASAPADSKLKTHAADLRGLLLPLPAGAVATGPSVAPSASAAPSAPASPSPSAPASASPSGPASPMPSLPSVAGRWIPCDRDAMLATDDTYTLRLTKDACRGAAAQGWTTPDGTRTELRLFHFGSSDEAADYFAGARMMNGTKDIGTTTLDSDGKYPAAAGQLDVRLSEEKAGGAPTGSLCWLQSGDVVALIQMTNPEGVPAQAFRQVVALQSSLLA
ncbi:hypothetical protein Kpho02_08210 [Kitasatospora phosalacinea]|uniref:Uncharacterized protein n=1 Tax=Kitasatospora phosalacinea TaxID=2065 RepID=A0A9W6V0S1_9ACTN|nr:hypothetical protein [Kitasatospora phosalacinea]GLW68522.1 hypothetical protein Kpho02_08210 [Kitasatospora phosalacinea]